jgi:hypothetical protein
MIIIDFQLLEDEDIEGGVNGPLENQGCNPQDDIIVEMTKKIEDDKPADVLVLNSSDVVNDEEKQFDDKYADRKR